MSEIKIYSNFQRLDTLFNDLSDRAARGVVKSASTRSLRRAITTVAKEARMTMRGQKIINLKASMYKNRFRTYTNLQGDIAKMYGKLFITGHPENLFSYFAKRVRSGRSKLTGAPLYGARVNVLGSTYQVQGGFIAKVKSNSFIFKRKGQARLPVEKQKGPGMAELVEKTGLITKLTRIAEVRYQQEMERNLDYLLDRAIQKAKGSAP